MIVVADTTPLNYLILIDEIDILPVLHGTVLIPTAVHTELSRSKSPLPVKSWAAHLPEWCEVRAIASTPNRQIATLDVGEREAILLAFESGAQTVLMDDWAGRQVALDHRLQTVGTLATLEAASQMGLLTFRHALDKLQQTNFRVSAVVLNHFLLRNP